MTGPDSKGTRRLAAAVLALALLWPSTGSAVLTQQAEAARPNLVFVLVDDADTRLLKQMPLTQALVADAGARVPQFLFNQPLCCPSRATMLRGQYSQNTGVTGNGGPDGGYGAFYGKGNEASTVATWLDDAGYDTGYLGKYLNGYAGAAGLPDTHVPVGWDRWFYLFSDAKDGFDYTVNEDGVLTYRGDDESDYATDVLAEEANRFIREADDPFFLWVNPKQPHSPAVPAPRHEDLFDDVAYPRGPAFNEADVSDKPSHLAGPLLTRKLQKRIDRTYRNRLRSVQAIDELVASVVDTLAVQGELDNTYIVVSSDNGFHQGEHRLFNGKNLPYEEDVRVPLYIRGPGIATGSRIREMVGNVDLAPTFAAAAGVNPPNFVDGRSFLPLAQGQHPPWRTAYLLGRGRGVSYAGLRSESYTYVEYETGEGEFYDRTVDPSQLENTYSSMSPGLKALLHDRVTELRDCARRACRDVEAKPLIVRDR